MTSAFVNMGEADLQFTDSTTHAFRQQPDSAVDNDDDDKAELLDEDGSRRASKYNFWSVEFYQQFFDVDTEEVKGRIAGAMLPLPGRSFLKDVLKKKPDLYGPLWICTTLVISVAVSGNLASYFQTSLSGKDTFIWHYDFHKVTLAATAVFSYAWLVPTALYAFLWWTASGSLAAVSFLDLICLYGYSLAIYIPVSVLWLIQNSIVQWVLVLVGAGLSGGVVVFTLWPILKTNKTGTILMAIIVTLHLLLACGFMLSFFHVPSGEGEVSLKGGGLLVGKTAEPMPKLEGEKEEKKIEDKDAKSAAKRNADQELQDDDDGLKSADLVTDEMGDREEKRVLADISAVAQKEPAKIA